MNEWSYQQGDERPRRRGQIAVQALIFTPLFLVTLAGVIYATLQIAAGQTGHVVMLTVSLILGAVLGIQAINYLKDLGAMPVSEEGEVGKKWTKGNLLFFFMPSYYIAVKGKIFSIPRLDYASLLEGDLVRVRHYPNSLTVETLERYDEASKKFVPASDGATRP